jgi:dihydrofolate reductase
VSPLCLVVAVARNGVIGKNGALPWRYPEDLRHFKRVTVGHAVIMGRRTWESIGKPLVERRNIVVSRQSGPIAGVEVVPDLERALELARTGDDEPRVIGGAALYRASLPLATRLYLTEVALDAEGDTFFPALDRSAWRETERRPGEAPALSFVTLERL